MTDLAGIGDVLGKRLSGKGFDKVRDLSEKLASIMRQLMVCRDGWVIIRDSRLFERCESQLVTCSRPLVKPFSQAYVVLGQFLLLKKNKDLFVEWLKDLAGANTKQSADCYQCLSDWCDEFL